MPNGLTVENVDVEKVLSVEGAAKSVDDMVAALEEIPAVKQMLEAAKTVEDIYQAVKGYLSIKVEDFKVLFHKTVDYFKEPKVALADDVMENVVGGAWGFFETWKKKALAATLLIGAFVEGALIGAAVGGPVGAVAGAFVGLFVGAVGASYALDS